MDYEPGPNLCLESKPSDITSLVGWLLNWANRNFAVIAGIVLAYLATKIFRIKITVGGK
jgi:hypothetical protein